MKAANGLTVEMAAEFGDVTHWKVSAGKEGGAAVTVRRGKFTAFACLTCYKTDCIHVAAARECAMDADARERVAAGGAA